jgi:hypothetical protein
MTTKRILVLALAVATSLLAAAQGCGGVKASREGARDQATAATCKRYDQCGLIGAGKTYETSDSCSVDWTARWESQWPAADCEGQIKQDALNVCLDRIASTDCTSVVDFLSTLLGTCSKQNVCGTGADGGG